MNIRRSSGKDCEAIRQLINDMEQKTLPVTEFNRIYEAQLHDESSICAWNGNCTMQPESVKSWNLSFARNTEIKVSAKTCLKRRAKKPKKLVAYR